MNEPVNESLIDDINAIGVRNELLASRIYVHMIDGKPYGLEGTSTPRVYRCINAVCPRCAGRWVLRIGPRGPHICNHCGSALGEFEIVSTQWENE